MQSKKPIYKKPYEPVDSVDESVWLGNDTPVMESDFTFVFNDRYPCVPGHKLFIPKENNSHFLGRSYGMAYDYGNERIKAGEIDRIQHWDEYRNTVQDKPSCGHTYTSYQDTKVMPKQIGGMRHAHPGADHRNNITDAKERKRRINPIYVSPDGGEDCVSNSYQTVTG